MKLFKSEKLNQIKKFLKKLPIALGKHTFLTFLGLLSLAIILASLIFYQYSILAQKVEPQIFEKQLKFQEKFYQEILKIWELRQKRFEEAELKTYPNPFPASVSKSEEELTD